MRCLVLAVFALGCEGPAGPQGPAGDPGQPGDPGSGGPSGDAGTNGASPWLTAPGVAIEVTSLTVERTGAAVRFTLTDGHGVPLDRAGLLTDGRVNLSFVLAQLAVQPDGAPAQYTAYTTHEVTSDTGVTTAQPTTESSGSFTDVDVDRGVYAYAFAAPLGALDPTLTQTVGALAVRTTATAQAIARTTRSVRPDGGTPIRREVVTDPTCGSCHRTLDAHGGRWTSTEQCVLCHQPQNLDPDTNNSLDFRVMVHKIHDGADLPSVVAGTPYQLVGYMGAVSDFSTVEFPQNIARCAACHAGAQGERWASAPTKPACTSCHDNISFSQPVPAGMVLHGGGVQPDNAPCTVCHPATGSIAGIADKHLTGLISPQATRVELAIQGVANTSPGQTPVMTFRAVVDGTPRNLLAQPFTSLTATMAGPTTDYATMWQARIQGTGAVGTLAAVDAADGVFAYTFPPTGAIPAVATGSYSIGLEGYVQPTPSDPRYAAVNPVLTFAVTDATPAARRSIVSRSNCNSCHYDLAAHGGSRKNPDYCVFCHNPATFDSAGAARFEATSNVVADTIDFRRMIHKVHAGENLSQGYVLGGFPLPSVANPGGTPVVFSDIRYPRPLQDCSACHAGTTWTLPMTASPAYLPTTSARMSCSEAAGADANSFCDNPMWTVMQTTTMGPQASVCTSCHDAPFTAAHAELETTSSGVEACATCHGPGTTYDVARVHGAP